MPLASPFPNILKVAGSASFKIGELTYGINIPYANYAPWRGDARVIKEAYRKIKGKTLVDKYRCWELWETAHLIAVQMPEASILEIGVYKGGRRRPWPKSIEGSEKHRNAVPGRYV